MSILSYLNLSASQNKKSDPGIFDIFNPPTKRSKKMTEQQQLELAQTGAPPTEEKEYTSKFDKFTNYIDSKMFSKKSNDWTSFILESISYSILILIIGIIGGNLENISNLKDEKNKGNSYLLRNKFEGLFKHSLSANSQLKIDSSINPDLPKIDFKVWCSLCDLSVQTKLLLQAWPLKIFDYANYVMCNISFTFFNDFLTKGKAFKAYFFPILLILIIYFQVPIIIGFIVALLGSAQHPNFPGYWFGGLAYLTFIKKVLKNVFDYIVGDLACKRYEAMPDAIYILRPSRDKTSQAMGKLDDAGLLLDVSFDLVTEPIALTDNHRKNSVFSDLFLAGSEGMKGLDESGYKNMFRIGKSDNYIRKLAISRLIEIIEDTPCHMDAYDIRGKKIVVATHNQGKLEEISALLGPLSSDILSAKELQLSEPEETEDTFVGNARIKAHAAAKASGLPVLSDDSGIEIDALDGAPGVYTADWAETSRGRDSNVAMRKVHEMLEGKDAPHPRIAQFCCTIVLAWPDDYEVIFEGKVEGKVVWPMRGKRGHGYDPIFQPKGYSITFGEMNRWEKNKISHRAKAFEKLFRYFTA